MIGNMVPYDGGHSTELKVGSISPHDLLFSDFYIEEKMVLSYQNL